MTPAPYRVVETDPSGPAVEVAVLRHRYGGHTVLQVEDWRVPRGADCVVLGPSGCGKTTLLNILAGLTTPSDGRVCVEGVETTALSPAAMDRFRARRIGLVPQRLHLIAAITVADNLRLARRLAGLPPDEDRLRDLLSRLGVGELAGRRPHALSQGQAQRAAVARALINQPALLLADEPTAALDDKNAEGVITLLREAARANGATLIAASHDRRVAGLFQQQLVLEAGA